eukprot:scaffold38225_cov33-Prasinocladus_malaysianus.AAC.1
MVTLAIVVYFPVCAMGCECIQCAWAANGFGAPHDNSPQLEVFALHCTSATHIIGSRHIDNKYYALMVVA